MTGRRGVLPLAAALLALGCPSPHAPIDADGDGVDASIDCDDANPALHAPVWAFADEDGDGVGAGSLVEICTDGTVPAGHARFGGDCAPADPAAWRLVVNPPVDLDGDGVTAPVPVTLCIGDTLPAPYLFRGNGNDCDDADPTRTRWVALYRDLDGDGIGAGPREIACLGEALPAQRVTAGLDLDDGDASVGRGLDEDDLLRLLD